MSSRHLTEKSRMRFDYLSGHLASQARPGVPFILPFRTAFWFWPWGLSPRQVLCYLPVFFDAADPTVQDKAAVGFCSADPTWRECGGCGGRLFCEPQIICLSLNPHLHLSPQVLLNTKELKSHRVPGFQTVLYTVGNFVKVWKDYRGGDWFSQTFS